MRRRDFLTLAGATAATLPVPVLVRAQQAKVPRIAFVWPKGFLDIPHYFDGLADFGYVDGKTAVITSFIAPTLDDMPAAVADAVTSKPDIILVQGSAGAVAAKRATSTIPIVFGLVSDPVGLGVVPNLARPDGNLTGTSLLSPDLVGKTLAIAKEAIPMAKRLVGLTHSSNPSSMLAAPQIEAAAKALGMDAVIIDFVDDRDFIAQFDRVVGAAAQFVYVFSDVYFATRGDLLADLQIKNRLPLVGGSGFPVLGYGPSTAAMARRTGSYVDAILKGAKPGDLPIEQPTVFDLIINLTVAKAIGMTIPPSVFAQATRVIE